MAKPKDIDDSEGVSKLIQKLEPDLAEIVEAIRQLILKTDKEIGEQVKWNSPSFFYKGNMKSFDPKEYKRDIVVINVSRGIALLVLPTGAKVKDSNGLLEGDYKDGRRLITFKGIDDVKNKGKDLQKVIKQWINLVDY